MKLYEMADRYNRLLEMAEEMDPEALADTLESLGDSIEQKVENTAKVIKSIEVDITAIDEEIKRLQGMKSARKNNIDRMKVYLKEQLEKVGMDKVKGTLFTVALQNNPAKLVVNDISKLQGYLVEQEPKVDSTRLKSDLKAGLEVEGAELVQEKGLRIR